MFFEDMEDKKDTIFENKIKTKSVDSFTPAATSAYPSNAKDNHTLELKRDNYHKDSIATTNPIDVPYHSMKLEFYFQTENFESGDTFVVEYATQIDSPVWEVLFIYDYDEAVQQNGDGTAGEWSHEMIEWNQNKPGNAVIQFRCESSDKKSKLYIDDITLMARD